MALPTLPLADRAQALDLQKLPLASDPAGVSAELPAGTEHPVAGHDDRQGVGAERVARGAESAGAPGLRRDAPVGRPCPERHPRGRLEDAQAEAVGQRPVELEIEVSPAAVEVLLELP